MLITIDAHFIAQQGAGVLFSPVYTNPERFAGILISGFKKREAFNEGLYILGLVQKKHRYKWEEKKTSDQENKPEELHNAVYKIKENLRPIS